jgi:hypothetical protein
MSARVFPPGMTHASHAHRKLGRLRRVPGIRPDHCHGPSSPGRTALVTTRLTSSFAGPLRKLLLAIPNYAADEPPLAAVYKKLRKSLPSYTHFVILTHRSARAKVARWFRDKAHSPCSRCRIIAVPDEIGFSIWAEDPYVTGTDPLGRGVLVDPLKFERNSDSLISSFVAREAGMTRVTSPLIFQGGNVLVGDDFYLVGSDYLHDALDKLAADQNLVSGNGTSMPMLRRIVRTEFLDASRTVHFIGVEKPLPEKHERTTRVRGPHGYAPVVESVYNGNRAGTLQPLFHIDMFVTLAGREADGRFRILVGDPRLAAKILGTKLPPHAMATAFDEIAARIAKHRREFVVTRNPLPCIYLDYKALPDPPRNPKPGGPKTSTKKIVKRYWYFATANNALVENAGPRRRRVWLPSYGYRIWESLRATDDANRKIWEDLGFEVTMLPNFHGFAENLGAVHCIKKYLER